jgi:molybdopterin converting factor small subunit
MPIPDTAAINQKINDALASLSGIDPFPLNVQLLLQMDDLMASGEHLLDDPSKLGKGVRKMLAELKKTVLTAKVSVAADAALSLDDVVTLLGKLQEALAGGKAGVDLPQLAQKLAGNIVQAVPAGVIPLAKKLQSRAPDDVVAQLLAGSDSGALTAGRRGIAEKIAEIAAAGSKLVPITVRLESLTAAVDELLLSFDAGGGNPDFQVILPKLLHIEAELDVLIGDVTPLLGKIAAKLDTIETKTFTRRLIAAFDAIAAALPDGPIHVNALFAPLREARDELHALAGGDLTATIEETVAEVRTALEESGIGDAGKNIRELVDAAIREVDLAGLKAEVEQTLQAASSTIRDVATALPGDVRQKLHELSAAIAAIDVEATVQELVDHLTPLIDAYKNAIDPLATGTLLKNLMDPVSESITPELLDALGEIDAQLQALAKELDAIDFEAAAAESRRLMEEIRTNVEEAVDSADLSPAARTALSLGAKALGAIDFENDVVQPIRDELDKADPTPIIARLEEEVAKVRAALASVSPSAIIEQLDPPFDDAMLAIAPYQSDALIKRVAEEVAKLQAHLDRADPGPLLAQLETEHAKLLAVLEAQADLDPYFRPVELAYLQAVAAMVELRKQLVPLFDAAVAAILAAPQEIETAVHEAMAEAATLTGPIPGFHLGDVLRPFADVVDDLRAHVDSLSDAQLEAMALIVAGPALFLQSFEDLDALFAGGPVSQFDTAWQQLTNASESLRLVFQEQVALGHTTATVQLGVRLHAVTPDFTALQAAAQRLVDRIVTPELTASANHLADAFAEALPPELMDITEETPPREAIELLLTAIDPTPIVEELDQIGEDIDTDLHTCAQQIADGVVQLVKDVFGVLNAADVQAALLETLDQIDGQLALLDPKPVQKILQKTADDVVQAIADLSPQKMKEDIDALLGTTREQLNAIGPALLDAIEPLGQDFPIPDLSAYRPSTAFAPLVDAAKTVQAQLDKILAFEFGEPLLRTVDRLRPALSEVLDDVFHELDRLIEFMEQQKAA